MATVPATVKMESNVRSKYDVGPDRQTHGDVDSAQGPKRHWLFRSKRREGLTPTVLALGIGLPVISMFVLSLVLGLSLNSAYTGDALGGGKAPLRTADLMFPVDSDHDLVLNALESACASAAVAAAMGFVRFVARNYTHPRVYGVFSFVAYLVLTTVLLWQVYSGALTVITNSEANGFSNQIYALLGGNFDYADSKFPSTFKDISQTSDFWNWMKGPVRAFVLSNNMNAELTIANPGADSNSPAQSTTPLGSEGRRLKIKTTWLVSWCSLRLVITESNPPESKPTRSMLGTKEFSKTFPPFTKHNQIRNLDRALTTVLMAANFSTSVLPNSYVNVFGQTVEPWDLTGSTGIHYPGAGGVVHTDLSEQCNYFDKYTNETWPPAEGLGLSGCLFKGTWFSETFNLGDYAKRAENYDREIKVLSENFGIPSQTALAQLSCNVVNSNLKMQASTTYAVEFMSSGQVLPVEPKATLAPYPVGSPDMVYFPLVLALYIMCEEIQDMVVAGPRAYWLHEGWLNLMDLVSMGSLLVVFILHIVFYGVIPQIDTDNMRADTWWTMTTVRGTWQTVLGLACFSTIFKGLKFTHNVPIMSHIGNTFSHALVNVSLFLVVVLVMLLGFGVLCHVTFSSGQDDSFNSLGLSLFSLFRGLLGDMNVDSMYATSPTFGPVIFAIYVTMVLFVAFTILIALICESFSAVVDVVPTEGAVVNMIAWYHGLKSGDGGHGDEEHEEEQPTHEESASLTAGTQDELLVHLLQRFEQQDRTLQGFSLLLESLDLRMQNIESSLTTPNGRSLGAPPESNQKLQKPDHVMVVNPLVSTTPNSNVGVARAARNRSRPNNDEQPRSVEFVVV